MNKNTGEPPTAVILVCTWRRGAVTRWSESPSFYKHYPPTSMNWVRLTTRSQANIIAGTGDNSSLFSQSAEFAFLSPPPPSSLPPPHISQAVRLCLTWLFTYYSRCWGAHIKQVHCIRQLLAKGTGVVAHSTPNVPHPALPTGGCGSSGLHQCQVLREIKGREQPSTLAMHATS